MSNSRAPCMLCGGVRHRAVFSEFGTDVLRCEDCGHMFSSYSAEPDYAGFWGDNVADEDQYYWEAARRRMHGDFVDRFIRGRSGRLLDMGCGLGYFVKKFAQHPGWEAFGCEISPAAVSYAREKLGLANVMGARRLQDADFSDNSFDLITFWDVLEHVLEPDPLLARCGRLLHGNGVLFIRTPNATVQLFRARFRKLALGMRPDVAYLMARDHLHHYTQPSIRRLLERNGFARVEFLHLHPIEGMSRPGAVARMAKETAFQAVRAMAVVSGGRWNFDNLFVVARKA